MTTSPRATYRPTEVLTGDTDFFQAYSLVDITDTGFYDPKNSTNPYKQAQNLNSLIQALSLRTQLVLSSVTILTNQDLADYNFGTDYTGLNTIWLFKFASEKVDSWQKGLDNVYFATDDVDKVPIFTGLDETATISNARIDTKSVNSKNLYFIGSKNL
jgi:hypothetical protein